MDIDNEWNLNFKEWEESEEDFSAYVQIECLGGPLDGYKFYILRDVPEKYLKTLLRDKHAKNCYTYEIELKYRAAFHCPDKA